MNFSIRSAILSVVFFLGYIIITLLVGEWHPFSNFPMYNNFPNWAYVFYVTDSSGKVLYNEEYFDKGSGSVAHMYYAACQHRNIKYGDDMETTSEMQILGNDILDQIELKRFDFSGDSLFLFKKTFMLVNGSILEDSVNIAARHVEKSNK